ncbi:uncharacterized protein LOC123399287 [Hordeum vulgare subsp. vulgare]|uniref:Disease resistance protein At4g27190-like leucine-rich repeats domain-containing protein n=1 Tax=Hordeum vulgare subsp. vulgare TaxID=112509 RepID=A0A8I6XGC7_HORVV|nr:uncharacterized protein LOC123399287 [Hordeum vulgare subsp. vulgare]
MDVEEIFGWDIDGAKEQILEYVTGRPEKKVIYFHGWDGFGASPVLRSIAQVLSSLKVDAPRELRFDRIIYVDCSRWKSRREMQRVIAEELKLDRATMDMFIKQDEEDDFSGLDQDSRDVIPSIATEIDRTLRDCRFMMIFLNGSEDEVDVTRFGIPQMTEFRNNRMIWTFKRRLLTIHRRPSGIKEKLRNTQLFLDAALVHGEYRITESEFCELVHGEAATTIARYPYMLDIDLTMVADCCLLELSLHYSFHSTTRFGWAANSSNYWLCNGIIQGDRAMEISNALHEEIKWECDASLLHRVLGGLKPLFLVTTNTNPPTVSTRCLAKGRWISITSQEQEVCAMKNIPATASLFFLAFRRTDHLPSSERSDHTPAFEGQDGPTALLPSGLFEHSRNLAVLVLSYCAFCFTSPPFLTCQGLRFLGLDQCKHKAREGEGHTDTEWTFLLSICVLEVRYTEWDEMLSEEKMDLMTNLRELNIEGVRCWKYINQLQKRLAHLHRLRITKPVIHHPEETDIVVGSIMDKLEILDLSGDTEMKVVPISLSNASRLQVLVLDGCSGLECVVAPDTLPPSLLSFSFDGYGATSHWTPAVNLLPPKKQDAKASKISLEGCTSLEKLFLRGLPNLVELDLSGTAIKILDFTTMVVQVQCLRRLFLLGCEHLLAIRWDQKSRSGIQPQLELLCIDTRSGTGYSRPSMDHITQSFRLKVHAILSDARLARSLWPAIQHYRSKGSLPDVYFNIHITSLPVLHSEDIPPETTHRIIARQYGDVRAMVGDAAMQAFPEAPTTELGRHVEFSQESYGLETELLGYVPARFNLALLIRRCADSMYLHDISTSASMPINEWNYLRHCRVERCAKLDAVFPGTYGFDALETVWASDLLMARCIWRKGGSYYQYSSFRGLRHVHLRSCPRLRFVLPVWVSSFPSLETLHITQCRDLRHVFMLDEEHPEARVVFPKLTAIHLHDLPMLRDICEAQMMMLAPALHTVKVRGCWGLRRLPAMEGRGLHMMKKPDVEIEKDVWDALEWDGVEAGHHPSLFEDPLHSRYYKATLPRVSVLR